MDTMPGQADVLMIVRSVANEGCYSGASNRQRCGLSGDRAHRSVDPAPCTPLIWSSSPTDTPPLVQHNNVPGGVDALRTSVASRCRNDAR